MKKQIQKVFARQILDSRGNPTIEVDLTLEGGFFGRAAVPSGASTGSHEAFELRDGDNSKFHGMSVTRACENVNTEISVAILKKSFNQNTLDDFLCELDGSQSKSRLGANAILAVSSAFAKAASQSEKLELYEYFGRLAGNSKFSLPTPFMNVLNGGKHANNSSDIQEFMIVPHGFPSFAEKLRAGSEIFQTLKTILKEKGISTAVGDEGGFAPQFQSNTAYLDLLVQAITESGYKAGLQVSIALDVAASELVSNKLYSLRLEDKTFSSKELLELYNQWIEKYPILSLEDGFGEDDWDGWKNLTEQLGSKLELVGDDLFVTDAKRLKDGIASGSANAILIKPNQIGTISESIATVMLAKSSNYKTMISHRSGETTDTLIADLAVGLDAGQIKSGSLSRGERVEKYNRLLRIEENLHK